MGRPAPLEQAAINARRGDYPQDLAGYTRSISIQPADAGVYFNRALIYRQSGKRRVALAALQQMVLLTNDLALLGHLAEQLHALLGQ